MLNYVDDSKSNHVICSKVLCRFLWVYLDMPFTFQHNPAWPQVSPSTNDTWMTLSAANIFHKGHRPHMVIDFPIFPRNKENDKFTISFKIHVILYFVTFKVVRCYG